MATINDNAVDEHGKALTRYEARVAERNIVSEATHMVSASLYNFVLGGTVAYGLIVNALMVVFLRDAVLSFVTSAPGAYWGLMIGYLVLGVAGVMIAARSHRPVISFLGYNMLVVPMGLLLTVYVSAFSPYIVARALATTGFITLFMMGLGSAFPRTFLSMGRTLFITLLVTLVVEVISVFAFGYSGSVFDYIFVTVFSLYIGFDFARSQAYARTIDNAVDSAVDIYLDIINLFIRLLAIFGRDN